MSTAPEAAGSVPGHNSGVPAEAARDEVDNMLKTFEARSKELLASVDRVAVTDNDTVGKAGDLQGMLQTLIDRVESRRDEILEPHAQAVTVVRRRTAAFTDPLAAAKRKVGEAVNAFRQQQRDAIAKQRREQAEREAELRGPAAAAPEPEPQAPVALPRVVGDFGSSTHDRTVTVFTIPDPKKVAKAVLEHPKVQEAMQQACRDIYKTTKRIAGVVITTEQKTSTRK